MSNRSPNVSRKASTKPTADAHLEAAIPKRIKALRASVGLTAADLDRLSEMGAGTTGRLERGAQRIYASHLYRIAQATGVDVTWFYDDRGIPAANASQTELETRRLLDAYMRITDKSLKHDVYELLESLAANIED